MKQPYFWHSTLQKYCAAKIIEYSSQSFQLQVFFFCNYLYRPTSYPFHSWGARIQEQPAPFTLPGQPNWHTFPANGATCRSVQGPVRTVSEGNADRAGGDVGGWWCWASVTGTSIRALSFPPVLLSATGTHTESGTGTGQGTNTCQEILSLWSEWAGPELSLPWHLDCNVKAAENAK